MLIQTSHYQFTISEPFAEGYRLTAAEAKALNSLRADRLRSALAKRLAKYPTCGPAQLISEEHLRELTEEVRQMDEKFVFVSNPKVEPKAATLEDEIEATRREWQLDKKKFDEPALRAEGRRRYEARYAAAREAIRSL